MRVYARNAALSSLAMIAALAVLASSAFAAATGGTAASRSPSRSSSTRTRAAAGGSSPAAAPTAPALHTAPVTGRSSSLVYHGPVYEKTATGQVVPYVAPAPAGQLAGSGGSPVGSAASVKPQLLVPGATARVVGGLAAAPMSAPASVQAMIWAGNQIIGLPYIFGGGHASFAARGYDCSGTVSFALHGASLLSTPMDSSEFMHWGGGGVGQWVTVFTNPGHAYMTIAGLRLDTSAADDPSNQQGPRWRPLRTGNRGFKVRHPAGL